MSSCVDVGTVDGQAVVIPVDASGGACVTAVLLSPDEYSTLMGNPLLLSLDGAADISVAIGLVWAVAWSFRQIAKTLDGDQPTEESK